MSDLKVIKLDEVRVPRWVLNMLIERVQATIPVGRELWKLSAAVESAEKALNQ